jgi:hypothetical protein
MYRWAAGVFTVFSDRNQEEGLDGATSSMERVSCCFCPGAITGRSVIAFKVLGIFIQGSTQKNG